VASSEEQRNQLADMIKNENDRMHQQVQTILDEAQMDREGIHPKRSKVSLHKLLGNIRDRFKLKLEEEGGSLNVKMESTEDLVMIDDVLIANMFNNLVDNAIKYHREGVPPDITISTKDARKHIRVRVEDNGIGMTKETMSRIFERFYRAHTGNLHNVKGFGIGLSYVKSIADAHGIKIRVESTVGKGSMFTIDFPKTS
jgi:two-component system phosphate regulon sensor histidine kinase PhoR